MKVKVHQDRCVASGMCAFTAPEVFDQNDTDGVVSLLQPEPPEDQHEVVRKAARSCPAQVISVE